MSNTIDMRLSELMPFAEECEHAENFLYQREYGVQLQWADEIGDLYSAIEGEKDFLQEVLDELDHLIEQHTEHKEKSESVPASAADDKSL